MSMNHDKTEPGLHRQRGQSLIEMAVALIVLVPLAAGIAVLGQYIHVKQQTQAAARQAAWAAAVDSSLIAKGLPDQNKQQEALRARIFGDPAAPLRSDARAPDALADTMLTTFAGNPLVKPGDLQLKVYSQEAAPSYLDQGIGAIGNLTGHLPPNDKGLITAEVATGTQQLTDRDGDPLAFSGCARHAKAELLGPHRAAGRCMGCRRRWREGRRQRYRRCLAAFGAQDHPAAGAERLDRRCE